MRIQEKQKALEQEVIANLCAIPKMPENMLPHTVYVEEEGEDGYGHGIPVYTMYRLEEIRTDGSCTLYNAESRERFTCRHLHEINMDWLVTVWERYLELCVEQDIWKGECRCIPERPYRQTGRGNHFIRGNLVGQMPGLYRQPQGVSWGR